MRITKQSSEMIKMKQQKIERQKQREKLIQRINQTVKLSQSDINELVLVLAREHGLIE